MPLFKRIEIWVLLAVIVAGLAFVFARRHPNAGEPENSSSASAAPSENRSPLKIHRCILERDYGNARLDIELRVQNGTAEKWTLESPKVKLLNAVSREIPSFFLPLEPLPEVPAQSTLDVQLRYWVEAADLKGALKLEVNGNTVEVKGATAFDLMTMKNAEKKTFNAGQW